MNLRAFLELGRTSNLPTVWSNVLAVTALCGGTVPVAASLSASLSCFYIGGMFLNDAFDVKYDRQFRPERPIVRGDVTLSVVWSWGLGLLFVGGMSLIVSVNLSNLAAVSAGHEPVELMHVWISAAALAAVILLYNAWHKANPLSPVVMGGARVGVYMTAGYAILRGLPDTVWWGALGLMSYIIGLTYSAKQENLGVLRQSWPLLFLLAPLSVPWLLTADALSRATLGVLWLILFAWLYQAYRLLRPRGGARPRIPQAVGALIAGIALWDACLCASVGSWKYALACVLCFGATLLGHRKIAGT